jgi:hypothetical protein
MPTYTNIKGIDDFGESVPSEQLHQNLIAFFDFAFLNKGAFFNTVIPTSGAYGGDESRLRVVQDNNYTKGRVWEGFRSNWIWESGVEGSLQPIPISGIYVNSVFYPSSTSGTYAHYIDYPRGRVVFNNAISTGVNLSVNYSHKWATFIDGEQPWFREVIADTYRIESNFLVYGSGNSNLLYQKRLQLPLIGIEKVDNQNFRGLQLGGGHIYSQDFIFNIITDDKSVRDKIVWAIGAQQDKSIFLYNFNALADANRLPLRATGQLASGALSYPDLIGQYRWNQAKFAKTDTSRPKSTNNKIYHGIVRITMEMDLPNV